MIVEICLPRNAPSVGQPPHTWPGSPTIGSGPFYCPSNRPLPVSTATRCSQNRCVLRSAREHRVFSQAKRGERLHGLPVFVDPGSSHRPSSSRSGTTAWPGFLKGRHGTLAE